MFKNSGCILKIKVWNQVDDPDFPHGEMNYYAQSDVNFLSKVSFCKMRIHF